MNLGMLLARHARYRPDHPAVVFEGDRLTYRQFNARVNRLANALLAAGLRKGDKIATVLPNCLEVLDVCWAAAKTGIVVVPASPLLQERGLVTIETGQPLLAGSIGSPALPASSSSSRRDLRRVDPAAPGARLCVQTPGEG